MFSLRDTGGLFFPSTTSIEGWAAAQMPFYQETEHLLIGGVFSDFDEECENAKVQSTASYAGVYTANGGLYEMGVDEVTFYFTKDDKGNWYPKEIDAFFFPPSIRHGLTP